MLILDALNVMINVAGISICFIFIVFIFNHKPFSKADAYLVTINVLLALFLGVDLLILRGLTPELVIIYQVITFLLFPFFFLYGMKIMRLAFPYKWIMFIPAFALVLYMTIDFYLLHQRSIAYADTIYRYPTLTYHIFYKGQLVFTLLGTIWFLQKIKSYQRDIRDQYSFIEAIELTWLKKVTIVFMLITAMSLCIYLIYNFNDQIINIELIGRIVNSFSILAIFYMSYNGIRLYATRSATGSEMSSARSEEPEPVQEKKYSKNALSDHTLTDIHRRLLALFDAEKPYLEPQLQLQQVARKLDVSTHALSQTINTVEKKSFYDFVNQYRIHHFKRLLADPSNKKFSILALGMDSGFNSKASMNRIFKELTGQSPSLYQKKAEEKVSSKA